MEFVQAKKINEDEEETAEGLWFLEIIQTGVMGQWYQNATDEKRTIKRNILASWGYGNSGKLDDPIPFCSQQKGILTQSLFVSLNKDKAEGVLFDIEPIYASCIFGLLAVDILTTSGARMNELLQINNTKECIKVKKVGDRLHYSYMAVPKGRDVPEEFYISKQSMELIQSVARMLKSHYNSDFIPQVSYRNKRKHLFPVPKPYYLQYHHQSFSEHAVTASIRFLLHGLRFETQEGTPVVVKSHLLRHAFATEAVQRQKIPVDIVAKILHQRDLNVTGYYSEPTPSQVAQSVSELHDVISSYVDVDEAMLRSPEDLQKEFEAHKRKVGVFNKVLGGTCVTDFVCPTKMSCLGCKAKIPQPEQENELLEVIELSRDMEKRFKKMNAEVEVRKAKEMRKQARIELGEIDQIKKYREEQAYDPAVTFGSKPSLA